MDFVSAIVQHIKTYIVLGPADVVRTYGGSPGANGYPFIVVDAFNWKDQTFNTKESFEETTTFQTTVGALDPAQADRIGLAARRALMPAKASRPKIEFDDGHETIRLPSEARKWNQAKVGPGGVTVYYYGFDTVMYVGKSLA